MKNYKSLSLIAFLSCLIFFSCQKEDIQAPLTNTDVNNISVKDGRLKFTSMEQYQETMKQLVEMNIDELTSWSKNFDFESLISKQNQDLSPNEKNEVFLDLESFHFPLQISAILNKNGEYMIGDTIVLYKEQYKHYIPSNNIKLLNQVRENINNSQQKFLVRSLPINKVANDQSRTTLGYSGGSDVRHQHEFDQVYPTPRSAPYASWRKYVHEALTFYDPTPGLYTEDAYLVVLIRMEYKNSKGKVRQAGEPRNMSWNLNGDYTFSKTNGKLPVSGTINANSSISRWSGDFPLTLALVHFVKDGCTTFPCNWEWNFQISGTITNVGSDDVSSNRWVNTGNPLW